MHKNKSFSKTSSSDLVFLLYKWFLFSFNVGFLNCLRYHTQQIEEATVSDQEVGIQEHLDDIVLTHKIFTEDTLSAEQEVSSSPEWEEPKIEDPVLIKKGEFGNSKVEEDYC